MENASTDKVERRPVAKGRKWATLNYDKFNNRFPILGMKRLAARDDPEGKEKLAALKEKYRRKLSARGRKRRRGGKRLYRYAGRTSPSQRKGQRFTTLSLPIETYLRLKEVSKFYKKTMTAIVRDHVEALFDEAYKQSELLARIEKNRGKNSVSPYVDTDGA